MTSVLHNLRRPVRVAWVLTACLRDTRASDFVNCRWRISWDDREERFPEYKDVPRRWAQTLRRFVRSGLILWEKVNKLLPCCATRWKVQVWEAQRRKMDIGKVSACVKSQQNVMLTQVTWGARQRCARVIHLHCTRPSPRQMVKIQVPSRLITRRCNVSTATCCQLPEVAWNSSKMESLSWNCLTAGTAKRLRGFLCQRKPSGHPLAPFRIDRRALLPSVVG